MESSILVGVLQDLGVNISASAIYDFLKEKFGSQSSVEKAVLEKELSAFLKIHGTASNLKCNTPPRVRCTDANQYDIPTTSA
jgi:hypothetical protein